MVNVFYDSVKECAAKPEKDDQTNFWAVLMRTQAKGRMLHCSKEYAADGTVTIRVPATRWVLEEVADTSVLSSVEQACVVHCGFVAGAQRCDAASFSISPAEAKALEPQ